MDDPDRRSSMHARIFEEENQGLSIASANTFPSSQRARPRPGLWAGDISCPVRAGAALLSHHGVDASEPILDWQAWLKTGRPG